MLSLSPNPRRLLLDRTMELTCPSLRDVPYTCQFLESDACPGSMSFQPSVIVPQCVIMAS
jgi:hypothetical protein